MRDYRGADHRDAAGERGWRRKGRAGQAPHHSLARSSQFGWGRTLQGALDANSIQQQKSAIASYASSRGYQVVSTYADEGMSGLLIDQRSGLKTMLADVLSGTPGDVMASFCPSFRGTDASYSWRSFGGSRQGAPQRGFQ
ncbi:recombinase family protein [Brevundimonas olei]|uniref:recombinase family protein n=1 Tax=Brevundimonas olei TaxID=657642 RepID=UPI003CD0A5F8